ncbi:MAG: hypothetical protein R2864_09205 [Syntrophotaleaceae bacterium]
MFRIRRIYDDVLPVNRTAIEQVQQILRSQFSGLAAADIDKLQRQLTNPCTSVSRHSLRGREPAPPGAWFCAAAS